MFTGDISTILLEAKSFLPNANVSVALIGSHDRTPLPILKMRGESCGCLSGFKGLSYENFGY